MDKRFQWTSFYMELASALLKYKNNRSELIGILKTIFSDAEMNFPFKEKGKEVYEDICPFTVSVRSIKELQTLTALHC